MMNLNRTLTFCALGLAGTFGCDSEGGGGNGASGEGGGPGMGNVVVDVGPQPGPDMSMEIEDTGPPQMDPDMGQQDTGVPVCEGPTGGFGTREGRNLSPFSNVTYCDGSAFDFYGDEDGFCDASVTVLIRAAEWCAPCRAEAQEVGAGVLDEYGPLGVRFLTVMDQNQDFGAPTEAACSNWEASFGLDREAIDHRMLMDPAQEVAVFFPPGQSGYPGNVIVGSDGQIIARINGFRAGLTNLKAVLDEYLGR